MRKFMSGITPARRVIYITLALCILIIALGAIFTHRSTQAEDGCVPLWNFNDGSRLWLCPANVEPDNIAFKQSVATATLIPTIKPTLKPTIKPSIPSTATATRTLIATPTRTSTSTKSATNTPTLPPSETPIPGPSSTPVPFPTAMPGVDIAPFPSAPLCPDWGDLHDTSQFHTLWDSVRGCHFDHEHGSNPFVPAVAAAFPGFNLQELGCGMQVNHCSPSSPIENTWDGKHGGWKWDVALDSFLGCAGFEGAATGINAAVVGYHNFGNYAVELNGRLHSAAVLARQCKADNPTDYGYVYVVQIQDYGQRTVPYQGDIMPYPDNPVPPYDSPRGPYVSFDCVGVKVLPELGACRSSLADVLNNNRNANSIWTSKPTGNGGASTQVSKLFSLQFRLRDTYQLVEWADKTYPFTFKWICSNDGGNTYAARPGCRYNNSTSKTHEIKVTVPPAWDNVVGLDTDSRPSRFSGEFLVTRFGDLVPAGVCLQPNQTCFRAKYVNAFVGVSGSELIDGKLAQFGMAAQPERDIYFCGTTVCGEASPGAQSSGWISDKN